MDFQEVFAKLGFDVKLAIINGINFVLFFFLINKFVISKVAKAVERRQKEIQASLENAEKLKTELSRAHEKAQNIIKQAHLKASKIISESKATAEEEAQEIIKRAQKESEKLIEKSTEQIEKDRQEMLKKIRYIVAEISVDIAEKILDEKIDKKKDKKIIDEFLKTVRI
jgi:F-type H+-transporting ATPase subunit b